MTPVSTKTESAEPPDPMMREILRQLQQMNNKLGTFEESVRYNSDMLDDMKRSMSKIIQENKELKRDKETLKRRVSSLEEEVRTIRQTVDKEDYRERANNAIIVGLPTDDEGDKGNVMSVLKKLEVPPRKMILSARQYQGSVVWCWLSSLGKELKSSCLEERRKSEKWICWIVE